MATITQNITIDVARANVFDAVIGKQYDEDSRFLKCSITQEGEPLTIPSGSSIAINAKRPDGTMGSFAGTRGADGTAIVPISSWILEQNGMVNLSVSIVGSGGEKLTSCTFYLNVQEAEGEGYILVYTAPSSVATGTYYITLGGVSYQFDLTTALATGDKIYFSSTYATGKTVDGSDGSTIETLTLTEGTSGTELVGSDVINFLASFMANIAELGNKADKVGESPDLVAGTAEQIIGEEFTENKVPYSFRQTPGSGKRLAEEVVGATVAWNQLVARNYDTPPSGGVTFTIDGATIIANGSSESTIQYQFVNADKSLFVPTHKYLVICGFSGPGSYTTYAFTVVYALGGSNSLSAYSDTIFQCNSTPMNTVLLRFTVRANYVADNLRLTPSICDLTVAFGPTIADYLYTLESNTPGAGVAKFRELFPADYYAFCEPTLQSVCVSEHREYGVNQFDRAAATPNTILAWATGALYTEPKSILSDYVRAIDGITLYSNYKMACYGFDQNKNYLGAWYINKWVKASGGETQSFSPSGAYYYRFAIRTSANGGADMTTADITINISNPLINGKYYPYSVNSYPLEAVELRGVLKLDGSNNIYADGDTYEGDGMVTRKYATLANQSGAIGDTITLAGAKSNLTDLVSTKGHLADIGTISGTTLTLTVALSGDDIVYELATPTTESADPYPSLQHCSGGGTEEYVDYLVGQGTRDVSIPAGHNSKYYPDLTQRISDIPEPPSGDGTYTLKCTVSSGVRTFAWV